MLKGYNKQLLAALISGDERIGAGKNIFEMWEAGAKELEKTAPGKIITAPIRLPAAVLTSTEQTVKEVPNIAKGVSRALPILIVSATLIGGGYLLYRYKTTRKLFSGCK